MNALELRIAYDDVVAVGNENEHYESVIAALGLDADDFYTVAADVAMQLERDFRQTSVWPPETATDRAAGLAYAFRLGVMATLKAVENAKPDRTVPCA